MEESENILCVEEIEVYTSHITQTKIKDIGSFSWFKNHERLHRLFQQAVLEASDSREERVKESLLLHGKIPSLVCETICISVWRELVLPELFSQGCTIKDVFILHTVMYQETTALGLLETILFHADCTNSLGGAAIDLIDYCHDSMVYIINRSNSKALPKENIREERTLEEELDYYASLISLDVAMRSVCVLRYVTENFEQLPVCVTSHFYNKYDFPAILSKLLDTRPWASVDADGNDYIFTVSRWEKVKSGDEEELPKVEAQVWLFLRHIILDKNFLKYYELNDFRKRELSKLLRYLHDTLLDQLSPLAELKHFLCQLSVANIPPPRNESAPLILEVGAEYREQLRAYTSKNLKKIARKQAILFSEMDKKQLQEIAKGLAVTYNTLDLIDPEPPKCSNCGDPAPRRCSRCKAEWYCGRECQVKRWTKHKTMCDLINESASTTDDNAT